MKFSTEVKKKMAQMLVQEMQQAGMGGADIRSAETGMREYAGRMSIEQSFRDDKSGGFDLAHTRLQHAQRIDQLLQALSIATLWCHELGELILEQGEPARCSVDPSHERSLSLFQLGFRWLKRFLATGLLFLPQSQAFLSNLKLKPVVIPVQLNPRV
jgi:hypothetical protein